MEDKNPLSLFLSLSRSFVKSYLLIYRFKGENKFSFYPPGLFCLNYRYYTVSVAKYQLVPLLHKSLYLQNSVVEALHCSRVWSADNNTANSSLFHFSFLKISGHCHCSELAWPLISWQFIMMVTSPVQPGESCTHVKAGVYTTHYQSLRKQVECPTVVLD